MKEYALIILALFALSNAAIVLWFFILEPRRIDREYERKIREIYGR